MVISQDQREVSVGLNEGARLWLKEQDKLQIVSSFLTDLINSGNLSQFVKESNLVLLVNPRQEADQFKTSTVVVFK